MLWKPFFGLFSKNLPHTQSQRDQYCEFVNGLLLLPQSGDFSSETIKISGMTTSPSVTSFDMMNKGYGREKNKQGTRDLVPFSLKG